MSNWILITDENGVDRFMTTQQSFDCVQDGLLTADQHHRGLIRGIVSKPYHGYGPLGYVRGPHWGRLTNKDYAAFKREQPWLVSYQHRTGDGLS